jgi:hypothetical protein
MKNYNFKLLLLQLFICALVYTSSSILKQKNIFQNQFSLEKVFLFFTVSMVLISIVSQIVYTKNKDIVGLVFMSTTSIKVILTYLVFKSVISTDNQNTTDRIYFFCIFLFYLTLETISTIRLLNKKQ